jgi:hypothetical protein
LRGLNLTIEKATEKLKVNLKNKNTAEIQKILRKGIVREVTGIVQRNDARWYREQRAAKDDDCLSNKARGGPADYMSEKSRSQAPTKARDSQRKRNLSETQSTAKKPLQPSSLNSTGLLGQKQVSIAQQPPSKPDNPLL